MLLLTVIYRQIAQLVCASNYPKFALISIGANFG
jgi:hypothetical protein